MFSDVNCFLCLGVVLKCHMFVTRLGVVSESHQDMCKSGTMGVVLGLSKQCDRKDLERRVGMR